MRICFISRRFFPAVSGMSVYAVNLLRELVRNNVDVTMISQYRNDELGKKVYGGGEPPNVEGIKVIGLESIGEQNGGDFEFDVKQMVQNVMREHSIKPFDVIHAQYGYPCGFAALKASEILNVPNVVSIQGGDGHWVGVNCCETHKQAMRVVLNHANEILIGSKSFANEVHENHKVDVSRFKIVSGAVDTERFTPRQNHESGVFIDKNSPRLLYHGRVDRRKGALDLIEAFAKLLQDINLSPKLVISGIGPDSEAVKNLVAELKITENVEILGYVNYDDVPQIYKNADIFVSPTYAEGFSNTILEAMASGLAIVSTNAVGVVDCLRDSENALLVEPADISALTNALKTILTNDDLRRDLAENALRECREVYSWHKIGLQIIGIYENLLGKNPDNSWTFTQEIDACRYRETPHLL